MFHTGHSVGDELLNLLNQSLPPLQTWETVIGNVSNGGAGGAGGAGLDPLNAQFLRLLKLFYLQYEYDPKQPSGQIFSRINYVPMVPQHNSLVALNKVLNLFNTTSDDLVQWLTTQVEPTQVPNIRAFNFDLLHEYLVNLPRRPAVIAIN
ncbi:hypothetical protein ACO0LF_28880 [Undibacterium sp. Di27W]|uniref:hypothetical protein n=1 Tax=Undibacterium sp. Di27W TaxID=3413036 RepID=UPI003BF3F9E7